MSVQVNPRQLTIEPNASCQLRCPTCPTTSEGYPPAIGKGHLRFEDFKRLLDDNPKITRVNLQSRGELFLNPELLSILECAFERGVRLFNSSGVNFNTVREGVLEGLVKYRFQRLVCSIDGASPETYSMYRVGGDFLNVIEHVKTVNEYKLKYDSEFPQLTWQFVVFGHNEHELPAANELAESLNMKFVPKMSWDSDHSPIRDAEFVKKHTGWSTGTREEFREVGGRNYMRSVCHTLWTSPRINWDGKVLGCCWNSWGDFGGNAFRDGYLRSINNKKIRHARKMLLGKAPAEEGLPCTTCPLYKDVVESGDYLDPKEFLKLQSPVYEAIRGMYHRLPFLRPLKPVALSVLGRVVKR